MRDLFDRLPSQRQPVPPPVVPVPVQPTGPLPPAQSGPRQVNRVPGPTDPGSGPRPVRPGQRPPRRPGAPPPAAAAPPPLGGGMVVDGVKIPLRLQKLVQSGRLTPQQAAARQKAFLAEGLPGQQKPTATPPLGPTVQPQPGKGPMVPPQQGGGFPGIPGQGLPGEVPQPYAYNDPFSSFLSAVPLIEMNTRRGIDQAMVDAGFSGNRYSDAAMRSAGQIGAEGAMQENALLLQTLFDHANRTEDRSLQATGMATGLGGLLDQIQQNQIQLPAGLGMWEQGRQDQFSNQAYEDFERNKLGWFPHFLQAAMSQNAGSPGQVYTTQSPGSPGGLDWLTALAGFF